MKYNTTDASAQSFTELMRLSNEYMGGGLGYGLILVFWVLSFTVLNQFPNLDALKSSTYVAWLSSLMFAVFGLVRPAFPMALFLVVAGLAAYQYLQQQ